MVPYFVIPKKKFHLKHCVFVFFSLISALLLRQYINSPCFHKSLASICIFPVLFMLINNAYERKNQGISSQFSLVNPLVCKVCFSDLVEHFRTGFNLSWTSICYKGAVY